MWNAYIHFTAVLPRSTSLQTISISCVAESVENLQRDSKNERQRPCWSKSDGAPAAGWLSVSSSSVVELEREGERSLRDCMSNPLPICCSLSLQSSSQHKVELEHHSSGCRSCCHFLFRPHLPQPVVCKKNSYSQFSAKIWIVFIYNHLPFTLSYWFEMYIFCRFYHTSNGFRASLKSSTFCQWHKVKWLWEFP